MVYLWDYKTNQDIPQQDSITELRQNADKPALMEKNVCNMCSYSSKLQKDVIKPASIVNKPTEGIMQRTEHLNWQSMFPENIYIYINIQISFASDYTDILNPVTSTVLFAPENAQFKVI